MSLQDRFVNVLQVYEKDQHNFGAIRVRTAVDKNNHSLIGPSISIQIASGSSHDFPLTFKDNTVVFLLKHELIEVADVLSGQIDCMQNPETENYEYKVTTKPHRPDREMIISRDEENGFKFFFKDRSFYMKQVCEQKWIPHTICERLAIRLREIASLLNYADGIGENQKLNITAEFAKMIVENRAGNYGPESVSQALAAPESKLKLERFLSAINFFQNPLDSFVKDQLVPQVEEEWTEIGLEPNVSFLGFNLYLGGDNSIDPSKNLTPVKESPGRRSLTSLESANSSQESQCSVKRKMFE